VPGNHFPHECCGAADSASNPAGHRGAAADAAAVEEADREQRRRARRGMHSIDYNK